MGKNTQITKQIGEALVIGELGKRDCIATSFAGNVPDFDIVAINKNYKICLIQVKAKNRGDWQLDIRKFWEIELRDNRQIRRAPVKIANLFYIFVSIKQNGQNDVYICTGDYLRKYFNGKYFTEKYKNLRARRRPDKPDSYHCRVGDKDLERYKNNWGLIC